MYSIPIILIYLRHTEDRKIKNPIVKNDRVFNFNNINCSIL